ncbi:uncharacterized protein LOC104436155 isoform X2 [Eucalyptus grandis]|uniref:uncharacterized protein LOC104436155 isoform X2 n=1 Tax=Eucalyptus grandis TaxID=71139 RepID=UPI00192E8660|nr:uncharacterized protein LOC104436155 isoform X2 [Eucalyptus grandis]
MLLGVEYARRRRFSLTHHAATSSLQSRNIINQAYGDEEELGGVAREAKHRLDERLRTQRKPETMRRHDDGENLRARELQLQTMVHGGQSVGRGGGSSNLKRFSWGKMMRGRAMDHDDCAICLERFEVGETLVHLPCAPIPLKVRGSMARGSCSLSLLPNGHLHIVIQKKFPCEFLL